MKYTTLLTNAVTEKDVENAYRQEFSKHWPKADITSPFGTDGLIVVEDIRLLCETKFDRKLKVRLEAVKVLGQLIYYVKKFQSAGEPLPNVLFAGDTDECFVVATDQCMKYLKMDIDWSKPPSGAHPELEVALLDDIEIAPFVYDVNSKVDFSDVVRQIEGLARGETPQVRATVKNIERLFGIWEASIFKEKPKDFPPVKRVEAFMKCLFYPEDVYLHPNHKNILKVNRGAGISTKVDAGAYRSFFNNFHQGYSPSEVDALYAVQDRIIEDTTRRYEGAFYTPKIWIDEAHRMLTAELGDDWRETHLVIDVAAGVANLTRDYQFSNLILSTLNQEDVDVIREQGYNRGCICEQWDFLRDPIPKSIEEKLIWAEENDIPVVWFSNPPYGTAGNPGANGTHKEGISESFVGARMKRAGQGRAASQELYTQFMSQVEDVSRVYRLGSILAYYTKANFMSGDGFTPFMDRWILGWSFIDGVLVSAEHFKRSAKRWGVSYTIWRRR